MSPIAKRLAATFYALGCLTVAVLWILFAAWLAPDPGPPSPRMAPIVYRADQLQPAQATETWEHYAERMREQGKEPVR